MNKYKVNTFNDGIAEVDTGDEIMEDFNPAHLQNVVDVLNSQYDTIQVKDKQIAELQKQLEEKEKELEEKNKIIEDITFNVVITDRHIVRSRIKQAVDKVGNKIRELSCIEDKNEDGSFVLGINETDLNKILDEYK